MDEKYWDEWIKKIDSAATCEELQKLANEAHDILAKTMKDLQEQLALFGPLCTAPGGDFGQIVSYFRNLVKTFKKPYDATMKKIQLVQKITTKVSQAIARSAEAIQCINPPTSGSTK